MVQVPVVEQQPARLAPVGSDNADGKKEDILVIAGGGGLALAGSSVERVIGYVYSAALIWGLGTESFGLFTLAMTINMFIGMMANLGLVQGVVRYGVIRAQGRGRGAVHTVTLGALMVSLPASVIIMLAMFWGAQLLAGLFHKPDLVIPMRAMAIAVPFMTIQSILLASTRALKVMKYSVITWVVQPLAALLLALPLLALKLGTLSVALAYSVSFIVGACLAAYYYLRMAFHKGQPDKTFSLGAMLKFSVPLSMIQWLQYANQRTETFFLGFLPSAVDVGVYNVALRLAGLEAILIDSLNKIFGPVTSELSHRHAIDQLGSIYKTMAKWAFTAALAMFVVYVLFGNRLMSVFDESYVRGTIALVPLGIAELINAITGPCGTVLLMSGRSGLSLMNTIILFATSILLDWLLIPTYGLLGATIAGLATIILVNVLRVIEVWVTLKIHPFRWDLLKPLTAAFVSFSAIDLLRRAFPLPAQSWFADVVLMGICVLLYALVIIVLKLDAHDMMVLRAVEQRVIPARKEARQAGYNQTSEGKATARSGAESDRVGD